MKSTDSEDLACAKSVDTSSDYTIAQSLQTIQQLVDIFQFTREQAENAVNVVGADVTLAYNYILDHGGEDKGGPIVPKSDCEHIKHHVNFDIAFDGKFDSPCGHFVEVEESKNNEGGLKSDIEDGYCPSKENWVCLQCQAIRCSRYVNGHFEDHWKNTKASEIQETGDESSAGHCIALSLNDLSVWCNECNAYLVNNDLTRLVQKFERSKFSDKDVCILADQNDKKSEFKGSRSSNKRHKSDCHEDQDDESTSASNKETEVSECFDVPQSGVSDNFQDDSNNNNNNILESKSKDSEDESSMEKSSMEDSTMEGSRSDPSAHPYLPRSMKDLAEFIKSDNCQSIVILAGAGMSRASGIPDFRSAGGLYDTLQPELLTATESQRDQIKNDPSIVFDKHLFLENPLPCLECKRPFILGTKNSFWKATLAHRFVELLHHKTGKLTRLYTQNIDGLERQCDKLPKEMVIPVHGSMDRVACELQECQAEMSFEDFSEKIRTNIKDISGNDEDAPLSSTPIACEACNRNTVKPTIVLFHSPLPKIFFESIVEDLPSTDLFIVIGTSLTVGPANSLVYLVPDDCLRVIVNNEPVGYQLGIDYSDTATRDYFARGYCDEVLLDLSIEMGWTEEILNISEQLPNETRELLKKHLQERSIK